MKIWKRRCENGLIPSIRIAFAYLVMAEIQEVLISQFLNSPKYSIVCNCDFKALRRQFQYNPDRFQPKISFKLSGTILTWLENHRAFRFHDL